MPIRKVFPVTAALITESGRVFVAKRNPAARMPGLWEFPGGKIEKDETPEQCLRRELLEEFEIDVEVGSYVGTNVHTYDFGVVELMAFKAKIVGGDMRLNDHSEVAWVDAEEIGGYDFAPADIPFVQMIRRGEIEL